MERKNNSLIIGTVVAGFVLTTALSGVTKVSAKMPNNCKRLWGLNRYGTAVDVAEEGWIKGSKNVVLASGEGYADALSAAPLAKKLDAPILLTSKNRLSFKTEKEIEKLDAKNIYIIGGQAVVSPLIEKQLKDNGYNVIRIGGKDRFETGVKVARELGQVDKIVIASGENYPDALSIASIAANKGMPVVLTTKYKIPKTVKDYVNKINPSRVYIIGDEAVIDESIRKSVAGIRIGGKDRFFTNLNVLKEFKDQIDFDNIYVASARFDLENGFADALSATALAAQKGAAVVLCNNEIEDQTVTFIKDNLTKKSIFNVIGGDGVVSEDVPDKIYAESLVSYYINKSDKLKEAGKYDEALKNINKAVELDCKSYEAYFKRSSIYGMLQEYNNVIADCNKAIELNPRYSEAYTNRGLAYHCLKDYWKALRDYNKAIQLDPNNEKAHLLKGSYYRLNSKEYRRAMIEYSQAISINCNNENTYYYRGLTYAMWAQQERSENLANEAIEDFNKAIELNPKYAEAYASRGFCYMLLKQYDKSLQECNKAIEIDPKCAYAYTSRSWTYLQLKEYNKALNDSDKAVALDSKDKEAYSNRARANFFLEKDGEIVIDDCNKALNIDHKYAEAYVNRGLGYLDLKEYDKAIEDFDRALNYDPKNVRAHVNKGAVYLKLNKYDKVIEECDKAINIDEEFGVAYLNRAAAYKELEQYKKAVEDSSKAISLMPKVVQAYNTRGDSYLALEEYYKAIDDFNKSLELFPEDAWNYASRGYCYSQLGEEDKAIKDYEKALKIDSSLEEVKEELEKLKK